jgi:hypothetical protein
VRYIDIGTSPAERSASRPYSKGRKNDVRDAEAIAKAVQGRPRSSSRPSLPGSSTCRRCTACTSDWSACAPASSIRSAPYYPDGALDGTAIVLITAPRCAPRCCPCIGAPTKSAVDTRQQFAVRSSPRTVADPSAGRPGGDRRVNLPPFASRRARSLAAFSEPESAVFPGPHQVPQDMFRVGQTKVQMAAKNEGSRRTSAKKKLTKHAAQLRLVPSRTRTSTLSGSNSGSSLWEG